MTTAEMIEELEETKKRLRAARADVVTNWEDDLCDALERMRGVLENLVRREETR